MQLFRSHALKHDPRAAAGHPSRRAGLGRLLALAVALACACGERGAPGVPGGGDGGEGGSAGGGGQGGSAGGGGQGGGSCYDYEAFEPGAPVDFRAEVLPLLQRSCATGAACHASKNGTSLQPYLGPTAGTPPDQVGDAELDALREQNVNADAGGALGMKRVAPGDPEHSFLMHKIDGTLACEILTCSETCGLAMPPTLKPLSAGERDTIRRWIAHGAAIE
ncbi:hypothetical protein [Sorangium sp. So ce861]|uniref:hypothetical protein n=1 Tax=Sorangium sp. So ce861 TaxID=3133323 RepID=UPI003F612345